jgi:hypothetical protein
MVILAYWIAMSAESSLICFGKRDEKGGAEAPPSPSSESQSSLVNGRECVVQLIDWGTAVVVS